MIIKTATFTTTKLNAPTLAQGLIFVALLLLAFDPALWLIHTWQDAAYDSAGFWTFICVLGLFIGSLSSKRITLKPVNKKLAYTLLILTAITRLVGQLLAVNTIGALALVIDVYAIAILLAVQYRARPLAPIWLAVLFAFSLPLERIIQRVMGFALQEISAQLSCTGISIFSDTVICSGTRIAIAGKQFLIDLPCSGSNSLVLLGILMTLLMVIARPHFRHSLIALFLIPLLAVLSNVLRIMLLVAGSLSSTLSQLNIDVMEQPWHEMTGLVSLLPAIIAMFWFFLKIYNKPIKPHPFSDAICWTVPSCLQKDGWWLTRKNNHRQNQIKLFLASGFIIISATIANLSGKPLDTAKAFTLPSLPIMIQQHYAHPIALLEKEQDYFTQYGGYAQKAIYGERQLLLSKTSSPLRHLHAPDECLRGLGFKVSYLGSIDQPIPSAIYKAISPSGEVWKVAVSFISESGFITTNVSEAVWQWIQQPASSWTAIQRISPWTSHFDQDRDWDIALLNALEISSPSKLPFTAKTLFVSKP